MGRLESATQQIDVAALGLIRDRERGVPRFNEFRRQYGLRQLSGFDDFIDVRAPTPTHEEQVQKDLVKLLREVYGQHTCDASKVITDAQLDANQKPIDDCLGHPNGSIVDNVEDVDTVVGWLAESTRPHGYAISETQFVVFILNASRRLFSDRFFTSSFRPEFYTTLGLDWVNKRTSQCLPYCSVYRLNRTRKCCCQRACSSCKVYGAANCGSYLSGAKWERHRSGNDRLDRKSTRLN